MKTTDTYCIGALLACKLLEKINLAELNDSRHHKFIGFTDNIYEKIITPISQNAIWKTFTAKSTTEFSTESSTTSTSDSGAGSQADLTTNSRTASSTGSPTESTT